ncbi:MAG: hypothetical protein ACE5JQ_04275 [Candidatus Methylomirabilales bacterium]
MKRGLLTALVVLLLPAALAFAQSVPIEVLVVLASREPGGGVDPAIQSLVRELQRDFAYTSYQLLETQRGQVSPERPWKTAIAGGRALTVALMRVDRGRVELGIKTAGVNTRVSLQRGGSPFLVGGPPHQNGVLIIVISAH